jgi:hypothetical protein
MTMLIRLLPFPLLALLVACEPAPAPTGPAEGAPLPPELCRKVREGLAKNTSPGATEFTETGEATIAEAAWAAMSPPNRDQLARTIAFHAVCARGGGASEQEVVVRSDTGIVLMRRTIDTQLDMGEMMGAADEAP